MFKSGLILTVASLFGFISSFLYSMMLDQSDYGELVTLLSITSILVVVVPFGTNAFFILYRDQFICHSNAIVIFPALIALMPSAFFLLNEWTLLNLALSTMLFAGAFSVQGVMASQIKQDEVRAAFYQSIQPTIKFLVAVAVFACIAAGLEKKQVMPLVAIGLTACSLFIIPIMLWWLIDRRAGGGFLDFSFFKSFTKDQWAKLISFWLASVLGIGYSLGIIPLVSYFNGYDYAAYLGLYYILWAGGNILILAVINNYYWPRYCAARSAGGNQRCIILNSLFASVVIAVLTFCGAAFFALFISEHLWSEYPEIDSFLLIASIAISIRVISAWLGMMIMTFGTLIFRKVKVQVVMILVMVIGVYSLEISDYQDLAYFLVLLEFGYCLGYLLSSFSDLKEKYQKVL